MIQTGVDRRAVSPLQVRIGQPAGAERREAGFEDVSIQITRRYMVAEVGLDPASMQAGGEAGGGKLASAFVRAKKPKPAPCCSSGCCQ